MRIGPLNKRITFQSPTNTADGMGGVTVTYTNQGTRSAAVWPASANEISRAGGTGMVYTHRIRIRYMAGILGSWRIAYNGRYFNIVSIINVDEGNRIIDILAKEAA